MPAKLRSDSFAAALTAGQRDELYVALCGGEAYAEARERIKGWGARPPSVAALSGWFTRERIGRTVSLAREAGLVAEASAPADYTPQERAALGRARFLASLQELSPEHLVALDRNDLARQRLELDRLRLSQDARLARRDLALDRARLLLERARGGESGEDLQAAIDLALDEIHRLKHGEEAA